MNHDTNNPVLQKTAFLLAMDLPYGSSYMPGILEDPFSKIKEWSYIL